MIRINLLPHKRAHGRGRAEGSDAWLWVVLGLLAVEIVALGVWYSVKQNELADAQQTSRSIEADIKSAQAKVANHEEVKKKLAVLRAREEAINKLQSARTGPTAMLLEVARIMTRGRGPTVSVEKLADVQRNNPLAMYNPSWDSRQVWLVSFIEKERLVTLSGLARDGEDVSELARRMNLSSYFSDVRLLPGKRSAAEHGSSGQQWVDFQLQTRVRY